MEILKLEGSKMNHLITGRIDNLINDFKNGCGFTNSEWDCYSDCKKEIERMENSGQIPYNPHVYNEYINYITEKLGI